MAASSLQQHAIAPATVLRGEGAWAEALTLIAELCQAPLLLGRSDATQALREGLKSDLEQQGLRVTSAELEFDCCEADLGRLAEQGVPDPLGGLLHRLLRARERPQRRVELVGDARDEAAHRGRLLGLHERRLRLATALPLAIGLPTLERLAAAKDPWNPQVTIKVPRKQVYRLVIMTASRIGSSGALRAWFRRLERPVAALVEPPGA